MKMRSIKTMLLGIAIILSGMAVNFGPFGVCGVIFGMIVVLSGMNHKDDEES